jgi:hypothetical protein
MNHEDAVVRAFIIPVRQERYLEFLKSPKNRKKFINALAHFKHLDPKFATSIAGNQSNPSALVNLLVGKVRVPNVGLFRRTVNWTVRKSICKLR